MRNVVKVEGGNGEQKEAGCGFMRINEKRFILFLVKYIN